MGFSRQRGVLQIVEFLSGYAAAKEIALNSFRRFSKIFFLAVIGSAAAGCVVVPFGRGRGHDGYGRGGHHYSSQVPGKSLGGADKEAPLRGPR
jgi:hypothetical protein